MIGLKMFRNLPDASFKSGGIFCNLAPNISMSNPETKEGMFHLKGVFPHKCI